MAAPDIQTGFAPINGARIYYEVAGEGQPFVMIHAGVADRRQWNNEFAHFAQRCRVVRYDQRGFGLSEPVEGEYRHLSDLVALLDTLGVDEPAVLMGCSMGGGLAMDFALTYPARTKALIMVDSGPGGLDLDVPMSPLFDEAEVAYEAGDLDRTAELEVQIWFDGRDRTPDQVDPAMRQLAYDMNRIALGHEAKELGEQRPNMDPPAAERLGELTVSVLVIVGTHDELYTLAAADYMVKHIPSARKVVIDDAAHLPNLDHPAVFRQIVTSFLNALDG